MQFSETSLRLKRTFHANRKSHKSEKVIYDWIASWNWLQSITFANVALESLFNRTMHWTLHCIQTNKIWDSASFHSFIHSILFFVLSLSTKFPILFTLSNLKWVFSFECRQFCEFFSLCKSLIWNSFAGDFALLNVLPFVTQTQIFISLMRMSEAWNTLCCHSSYSFLPLKCYHFRFNISFFLSFHLIQLQPFCVHFNLVLLSVVERFCFNATFCTKKCFFLRLRWSGSWYSLFISNICRTN